MPSNKPAKPTAEALAKAKAEALETRKEVESDPDSALSMTEQEIADAAPFYFVLRRFIHELRNLRDSLGLKLSDVAQKTGLAVESISRLETGAQTNPTWKTLGLYALAMGCAPQLLPITAGTKSEPRDTQTRDAQVETINFASAKNQFRPRGDGLSSANSESRPLLMQG